MSKRRANVVAAIVTALTLLGCGLGSAGGDGDLADDWRALPHAESFTPGKGCHAKALAKNASREDAATVDCTGTHLSETIFVGRLTGAVAELPDVPLAANAALVPAYTECHNRADALLGTWLDFRLSLRMVLPTAEGWQGGARWYACVLVEEQAYEDVTPVARMAAISPTTVPVHGCFLGTGSGSIFLREVACSTAHNAEYAGSFLSTASQAPLSRADWEALHVKCRGVVARFLGTSIERSNDRYSNIASTISKNFSGGERGVRCFLYLGRSRVSSSAEGRGTTVPAWS